MPPGNSLETLSKDHPFQVAKSRGSHEEGQAGTFLFADETHTLATSLSMVAVTVGVPMATHVSPKLTTPVISGSMNLSGTHAKRRKSWK